LQTNAAEDKKTESNLVKAYQRGTGKH